MARRSKNDASKGGRSRRAAPPPPPPPAQPARPQQAPRQDGATCAGALPYQDPHALAGAAENRLEVAIGREVRGFRRSLDMTVTELAKAAGLSAGMLSKIENGMTSPSLATLQALSAALHVPVTSFFRRYEETREATHVKSGQGLVIERRGTRAGHQYQLLGHSTRSRLSLEPYLITLTAKSDVFPLFQHSGVEFLYMLEGRVGYRHADKTYVLEPGDSLFFDSDAPHGPDELIELPARYLSIICYLRDGDEEE